MSDIEQAKQILLSEDITFVMVKGNKKIFLKERGIIPMFKTVTENRLLTQGSSVADKVVGNAGALLAAYGGIKALFTQLTTFSAVEICESYGIAIEYEKAVEFIQNRNKTGNCPMEKLSTGVTKPEDMVKRVANFISNNSDNTKKIMNY